MTAPSVFRQIVTPPLIFLWQRPTIKTIRPQPELATYLDRDAMTAAAGGDGPRGAP